MPFTLAHPAIVVPLARWRPRWFPLAALAIGSMAPDFEYFVRLRTVQTIGHELIGIPVFCVPAALLVLLVFEFVMKAPLIELLPGPHRLRLLPHRAPIRLWPASRLLAVVAALTLGAFSHLVWDAFTHRDRWGARHVPALLTTVLTFHGADLKVFKVLQYGSTAVGFALLAYWYWAWFRSSPVATGAPPALSAGTRRAVVTGLVAIALLAGLVGAWWAYPARTYVIYGRIAIGMTTSFFLGSLGYSIAFRLARTAPGV
jgi:hypothetical protein